MNTVRRFWIRAAKLALANSAAEAPEQLIGLANELEVDGTGWAVIPYGEWPHCGKDGRPNSTTKVSASGVVQRFSKDDAVALVNDFKSVWGRVKRAIVGLPVFKGHPDAPRFANMFPDKTPRGTISDMEARDDGLAVRLALTPQGGDDVEAGWKFISPYWDARAIRLANDGAVTVVAPIKLRSIGLVQKGNIPGLSLTNAAEPTESPMIKTLLLKLLAAMGVNVAADADDTALSAAVDQCCSSMEAANAAQSTLKTEAEGLRKQVETLTGEKTALANSAESEKTRLETALKEERKARSLLLVNSAIVEGRLQASEREATVTALCNNFDAEAQKLAALPKTLKTKSALGELTAQGKEAQSRQQQVLELVNAHIEQNGVSYEDAFIAVQRDPKNAALFAAMKRPEAKA